MASRKKPTLSEALANPPPSVAEALQPSGRVHADDSNFAITDDALISENFKIEELIKAATAKLNEWAAPHKVRLAEIEAELSRRLIERKANNTKTDSGTAYFSDLMNAKVESTEKLFDYVADNWDKVGADAKIALPVDTVRQHMEENDGNPPPGITTSYYRRLNIKRS